MHPKNMVPFKPEHAFYLAHRPLPEEIEQWEYLQGRKYDPRDVVSYILSHSGPAFTVLGGDGVPIACGGYFWIDKGVWQSWMVGTPDGWETNWRTLTKACRWLMEAMFRVGAQRLVTLVQPTRVKTCEWYERSLGMVRESDCVYARVA